MPRPIFINRFYWPDEPATAQMLTGVAESLASRNLSPLVITGRPQRDDAAAAATHRGVCIERVRRTGFRDTTVAGKAVNIVSFYLAAMWQLLRTARRGDVVVAMTDPPMLGVGAWLVARLRGARVVHWIQDIYPEIAIELSGHRLLRLLSPLRNAAWRRADACVTLGSDMAAVVAETGVDFAHLHIIPNAAPAELAVPPASGGGSLRREWGLDGKFVVAYSGNLGRVHLLDPVLAAAERLRPDPTVAFVFIGDGPQRARLESVARRNGLTNVEFRPAQPRARLAESLAMPDIHLVTLRPGCERYVFPSKFHGVVAAGRPMVFIGPPDCELARRVREAGLGFTFAPDEDAPLANTLARLTANPAELVPFTTRVREFAQTFQSADATLDAWQALLARLNIPREPTRARVERATT